MSPELAKLIAAVRSEGFPALAEEITRNEHDAHRYAAMRHCYLHDNRCLTAAFMREYDESADKFVHRYERERN